MINALLIVGCIYIVWFFNYKFRIRVYIKMIKNKPFKTEYVTYDGEKVYVAGSSKAIMYSTPGVTKFYTDDRNILGEVAYQLREYVKNQYKKEEE